MGVYGLDISNYQSRLTDYGGIVRDGFEFVFILASDGEWRQPFFRQQLDGCRTRGLLVAAYHYQREHVSAARQVEIIASQVPKDVPVVIDVEHHSGRGKAGVDLCRAIVDGLRARGYLVPLVYIPRWYWSAPADAPKGGLGYADLSGLPPLWVSWYPDYLTRTKERGKDALPASVWTGYGGLWVAVAQYTSSGRVSGYDGAVDQNYYRGSVQELAALMGGGVDVALTQGEYWEIENRAYAAVRNLFFDMAAGNSAAAASFQQMVSGAVEPHFAGVLAAVAGIAQNADITPEELREATLAAALEAAGKQASLVSDTLRGDLAAMTEEALRRVQDADNLDEAKKTVDELLSRISTLTGAPPSVADVNEDGLRGGAAAPDGVGGPTADDAVGDDTEEKF
ncbi:hypothetical protein BBK82_03425 [Lentzea guizhouensis]|uniref:Uncharacterized protein n=1 Tax=Lentzea guizhouensis TaxID=1586287 RepID=A0A1B2HC53_9PSEU|nr:glycoside hydrolase family 25 protein [Lentzea guizhouensis]ANZ35266.1 hypothetical protein BBK82_03425 [Lentzea guizhouensis]